MSVVIIRNTKRASDAEIGIAADDILGLLKEFDSPKDAGAALVLAHYKMLVASFPPERLSDAIAAADAGMQTIKDLLQEGWQ